MSQNLLLRVMKSSRASWLFKCQRQDHALHKYQILVWNFCIKKIFYFCFSEHFSLSFFATALYHITDLRIKINRFLFFNYVNNSERPKPVCIPILKFPKFLFLKFWRQRKVYIINVLYIINVSCECDWEEKHLIMDFPRELLFRVNSVCKVEFRDLAI